MVAPRVPVVMSSRAELNPPPDLYVRVLADTDLWTALLWATKSSQPAWASAPDRLALARRTPGRPVRWSWVRVHYGLITSSVPWSRWRGTGSTRSW